jgi:transcriptional regulator with XRE-family HTH domain
VSAKPSKAQEPHPVDVYVGGRLRLRRTFLGYSQEKLGQALGLTFQQIQKYERGHNRISSSKLYELSMLLEVPVSFFFEGLDDVSSGTPDPVNGGLRHGRLGRPVKSVPSEIAERQETQLLIDRFYRLPNDAVRREILNLMKAIGG